MKEKQKYQKKTQKIKNKEVIDFLEKNLNEDKDIIEKTMEELINEDNKRKSNKKNKKGKNMLRIG